MLKERDPGLAELTVYGMEWGRPYSGPPSNLMGLEIQEP